MNEYISKEAAISIFSAKADEEGRTMREILFRGKRLDNGEWVKGSLLVYVDGDCFVCCEDYIPDVLNKYGVDPSTVGQYTGLEDKNGKRIFEGDIVEGSYFTLEDEGYGVVGFDDGAFEIAGNDICATFHENVWGRELEVIGNIHDNPELLEGGQDNG